MGRKKLEIKQNVKFEIRVSPIFKKKYITFCKKNKFVLSKRVREMLENDMTENKNNK